MSPTAHSTAPTRPKDGFIPAQPPAIVAAPIRTRANRRIGIRPLVLALECSDASAAGVPWPKTTLLPQIFLMPVRTPPPYKDRIAAPPVVQSCVPVTLEEKATWMPWPPVNESTRFEGFHDRAGSDGRARVGETSPVLGGLVGSLGGVHRWCCGNVAPP